jgi:hypothetical protein
LGRLGGSGDATPKYKNQAKSMTRAPAIQEPKFSVCGIVFDGGCDGRGCGCHIFLALHARPSHTVQPRPSSPIKKNVISLCSSQEFPTNIFNHFWIQVAGGGVAVSEAELPLRNRFRSETVTYL